MIKNDRHTHRQISTVCSATPTCDTNNIMHVNRCLPLHCFSDIPTTGNNMSWCVFFLIRSFEKLGVTCIHLCFNLFFWFSTKKSSTTNNHRSEVSDISLYHFNCFSVAIRITLKNFQQNFSVSRKTGLKFLTCLI